jgi:amino-acid N-acetyltransferase
LEAIKVSLESFGISTFESVENDEKLWLKLYNKNLAKFIAADEKGKIIGLAGLFLFDQVATVGNMCVLQNYRRKRIGYTIFKRIMEKAKSLGYESIALYASELGEPLYKKYGFQAEHYVTKYQILQKNTKLNVQNDNIRVINDLPEWLINLDKQAFGSDRTQYLRIKMELGGKLIVVNENGYGLYSNGRIGPLIAKDIETATDLLKKSILLGADHLITPKYECLSKLLLNDIILDKGCNKPNLKMYYGKKIPQDLRYVYTLSTYAKG